MGLRIIPIGDIISVFPPQLGIEDRYGAVRGKAVPFGIGGIVLQCAQSERVFVEVLRFANQSLNEITTANVMREIAEKAAAERIISHVLNDAAPIRVGVRLLQLFRGRVGESLEKQLLKGSVPDRIYDRFVGENRVAVGDRRREDNRQHQAHHAGDPGPVSSRPIACGA